MYAIRSYYELGTPFILKIPDGSFSHGIVKISNEHDLEKSLNILFEKSAILLAQEFIPTDFDWRIGVLDGEPFVITSYSIHYTKLYELLWTFN